MGGLLDLLCELVDDFLGIHVQLVHHVGCEVDGDGEVMDMYNSRSLLAFYAHGIGRPNRCVGFWGGAVTI